MTKRYDSVFEISSSSDGYDDFDVFEFNPENCFYDEGTDLLQFFNSLKRFRDWAKEHNETHVHVSLKTSNGFMDFIIPFEGDTSSPFMIMNLAKE